MSTVRTNLEPSASDADLVRAAQGGEQRAFIDLVERHESLVAAVAWSLTESVTEAEEVAQQAFVTAWIRLGDLRRPERFRPWILTITQNLAQLWRERRLHEPSRAVGPSALEAQSAPTASQEAISKDEELALRDALAALPVDCRVPLVLFFRQDQTVKGVAEAMDISAKSVRTHLWSARKMLQERLMLCQSGLSKMRLPRTGLAAAVAATTSALDPEAARADLDRRGMTGVSRVSRRKMATVALALGMAALLVAAGSYLLGQRRNNRTAVAPVAAPPTTEVGSGQRQAFVPPTPIAAAHEDGPPTREGARAPGDSSGRFRSLLSFDFEDGARPPLLSQGYIGSCPSRADNRFCAIAALTPLGPHIIAVAIRTLRQETLFPHSPKVVIHADYWAARDVESMIVTFWNHDLKAKYVFRPRELVTGTWTHLALPITGFKVEVAPARPMAEGDPVHELGFRATGAGGGAFFVDNIEVMIESP